MPACPSWQVSSRLLLIIYTTYLNEMSTDILLAWSCFCVCVNLGETTGTGHDSLSLSLSLSFSLLQGATGLFFNQIHVFSITVSNLLGSELSANMYPSPLFLSSFPILQKLCFIKFWLCKLRCFAAGREKPTEWHTRWWQEGKIWGTRDGRPRQ